MRDILTLKHFLASPTNRQFTGFDAHQKISGQARRVSHSLRHARRPIPANHLTLACAQCPLNRHCERSEAIQSVRAAFWIASSLCPSQ
jgi:hypothetical protein